MCDPLCFCCPNLPTPHDLPSHLCRWPKVRYKAFIPTSSWHNIMNEWNIIYEISVSRSLYWPGFLMLHVKCVLGYAQAPHIFCIAWLGKYELFWLFAFRLTFYSKCFFVIDYVAYVFPPGACINFRYVCWFSILEICLIKWIPIELRCLCVRVNNHNPIDGNS